MAGQLLVGFHEPGVVDVELGPACERRVRQFVLDVEAEGGEGLVRSSMGEAWAWPRGFMPRLVKRMYPFSRIVSRLAPSGSEPVNAEVFEHLVYEHLLVVEGAVGGEGVVEGVEAARGATGILVLGDAAGLGALLDLGHQVAEDRPLVAGLAGGLQGLVREGEVHGVRAGDAEADLLVLLRRRQDDIGPHGSRAHA